ncbi:SLAP domain-containing protein [Lactobacillus terrae]|uniref:SLAP domain-containing protein n=1 Tax=Lactobacillus terrae TaxID=2269374 RepID=UPI000C1B76B7|nr:SLAP domain-containing protein [Lactobacillus terrae]
MKKSVKYAGIAAAALLTVAPAVAPVMNTTVPTQTQTAKATFDPATEEDAYNVFDATWKDYNNATQADFAYGAGFALAETNNRLTYSGQWAANGIVKPLHPQYQSVTNDADVTLALNEIVFLVVPPVGMTSSEWQNQMFAAAQHGGSVQYRIVGYSMQTIKDHALWSNQQIVNTFPAYKLNGHSLDKTVTSKTASTQQVSHALNINYATPVNGYVGESKSDFYQGGKYPLTIKNNLGETVNPQDVTSTFFKGTDILGTTLDASTLPTAGVVTQKMTIKFNRNEYSALLNDMDQITINGQTFAANSNMFSKVWDKINNTVTVTRQINVTTDNYTDTAIDNIVDTPIVNLSNDTIVTHVYDANGKLIANRALAQGTGWVTDTKRVNNATGQVYYRVATGEYVKAEDVTLRNAQ